MRFSIQPVSALATCAYFVAHTGAQVSNNINCGGNEISVDDVNGLIDGLRSNAGGSFAGLTDPLRLNSRATNDGSSIQTITLGSASVRLENEFVFDSTSVSFESLAQSIEQVRAQCCDGQPSCIGASSETKGDTGLILQFDVERVT